MPDRPLPFGAIFDAAVVDGGRGTLLRLRSALDALEARATWTRALLDAPSPSCSDALIAEHENLITALAHFGDRGRAACAWHRLVRWLAVVERGGSDTSALNAHQSLVALAEQRRAKSIKKFRQWLALPSARAGRNQVVRALAQAPHNGSDLGDVEAGWAQHRAVLATGDLATASECLHTWHVVSAWQAHWRATDRAEPEDVAELRRQLAKALLASNLDDRLARTLKYSDDHALWHCAGALQRSLQDTAHQHEKAARDTALLMRVPLQPRFGRHAVG